MCCIELQNDENMKIRKRLLLKNFSIFIFRGLCHSRNNKERNNKKRKTQTHRRRINNYKHAF
jgi:hypothetical protein